MRGMMLMWFSVISMVDTLKLLSSFKDYTHDAQADELCVDVSPVDIILLRKKYDVAVLDRCGKDYLLVDRKGNQFRGLDEAADGTKGKAKKRSYYFNIIEGDAVEYS